MSAGPSFYTEAVDADLVAWSARGDRRAFDEIVARYGAFALRVALRLIPELATAEDAAQDALVRAWEHAKNFDPERSRFSTWLYKIVVNRCLDQRRRIQTLPLPDDFDAADPAAGAEDIIAGRQRRVSLAAALRDLPARQRAAVTLVYDEGLSGIEAAEVLGVTAKAVERLLARARAGLRETMGKEM